MCVSLRDIDLEPEYRNRLQDIATQFYIPLLSEAVSYKRAVGFFSSSILTSIAPGLFEMYQKGIKGSIKLLASPRLSDEDIEAINAGYKERDEVIFYALQRELLDYDDFCTQDRLNLLANLIANEILDIHIAVSVGNSGIGIYHEKLGIIEDAEGNTVVFTGSMNESGIGLTENYEAVDVFCSWDAGDNKRIVKKCAAFQRIWDNEETMLEVKSFPELNNLLMQKYKKPETALVNEWHEGRTAYQLPQKFGFVKPDNIELYDYQCEAIEAWKQNEYRGIFDMATGTGKTLTALGALAELSSNVKRLAVIIVCPYQHLVEQWVEDIRKFDVVPIIGYSGQKNSNYKKELKNAVFNFNFKFKNFFCFITTNASFMTAKVRQEIEKLKEDTVLVVDEAHNFGAENIQKSLQQDFTYRLALSATLVRHGDEEGTALLLNYFEKKCIEYDLERAINEHKLTPYNYYPEIVYLTPEELDTYRKYTTEIGKNIIEKNGKKIPNTRAKQFMLKRARLIAGASGKIARLREMMPNFQHEHNMLIYCGATNIQGMDDVADEDVRQIDYISRMLNFDFNMNTAQFTSKEDMYARKRRIEDFAEGEIQALVAIKCLDEGVNIPSIQTAFILASTTNPKEYIQRRGRVLRLYPGKEHADIYDFVILPRALQVVEHTEYELASGEKSLVLREMKRISEFGKLASNFYEAESLLMDLRSAYDIHEDLEVDSEGDFYD